MMRNDKGSPPGEAKRQRDGGDVPTGLLLALAALPDSASTDNVRKKRRYWYDAEVALESARRRWSVPLFDQCPPADAACDEGEYQGNVILAKPRRIN